MSVRRAVNAEDQSNSTTTQRTRPPVVAARSNRRRHSATPVRVAPSLQNPAPKPMSQSMREEENAKFTPRVDRRIIEGMLEDRDCLLTEMERHGLKEAAILRRAAELGLSEALLRQVKGVAADLAGERPGRRTAPTSLGARTCLCCDRVFLSTGPGNRLCMRCRGGDAGLAQI